MLCIFISFICLYIHVFIVRLHTSLSYRVQNACARLPLISFALLFVSAALSVCCAADTDRDEGKRMSDASRERVTYISCTVCVCAVETRTHRSEVRSCQSCACTKISHSLSRARDRVKDTKEEERWSARLECVEKTRGGLCRGGRRRETRRTLRKMAESWCS